MQESFLRHARPAVALLLAALVAACQPASLDRPAATASAEQRAAQLERSGDHAGAARTWEEAARRGPPAQRAAAWLGAAREWVAAGDATAAQRALGELAASLPAPEQAERTRLEAEIAILQGKPDRALTLLKGVPDSAAALATRARAQFAAGRAADGARTLLAREALLPAGAAQQANQRMIVDGVRGAAQRGASTRPPKGADPILAGWLDLGTAAAEASRNPFAARTQLTAWRTRYPQHPANATVWRDLMQEFSQKMDYPAQVALLLPLSGRAEPAGAALRDGFLAAYYQQLGADRPQVRTYDVARMDVASAYLAAVTDGAGFVVGPLTRDEVAAVARVADGRTTVLALNYLPEGSAVPSRFYQFALSPEDEARQVARRAIADGRPRGVALAPSGDWGQRVLGAFSAELQAAGGQLADQRTYPPGTTDFGALIVELFGVRDSEQRHARLQGALGTKLEFVPQRRSDLDFIFIPGQPGQGRLIRPQLKFNYAGDLPAYSVSDVFEPGTSANSDLDGVIFPDIPWMLGGDPAVTAVRESVERLWPDRAKRRGRLFAMGFDAYRLVAELRRGTAAFATPVTGMTGRLRVDADRRVRRDLDWAQMRGGTPRLLPAANTTP